MEMYQYRLLLASGNISKADEIKSVFTRFLHSLRNNDRVKYKKIAKEEMKTSQEFNKLVERWVNKLTSDFWMIGFRVYLAIERFLQPANLQHDLYDRSKVPQICEDVTGRWL